MLRFLHQLPNWQRLSYTRSYAHTLSLSLSLPLVITYMYSYQLILGYLHYAEILGTIEHTYKLKQSSFTCIFTINLHSGSTMWYVQILRPIATVHLLKSLHHENTHTNQGFQFTYSVFFWTIHSIACLIVDTLWFQIQGRKLWLVFM